MRLDFISRGQYREKEDPAFLKRLNSLYPGAYMIPEGGNNAAGLKGCLEIPAFYRDRGYTDICCSVGTGTTLCALITAAGKERVTGFAALKNAGYLEQTIRRRVPAAESKAWRLVTEYHFGGLGKKTEVLLSFMRNFYASYAVPLDVVYTGKMMFGILDLLKKGYFPAGSRILAIHTGGLQGNQSLPTFTPQQTLP
jgi:1-aminocyclopropane-1-carboxylate deaminase